MRIHDHRQESPFAPVNLPPHMHKTPTLHRADSSSRTVTETRRLVKWDWDIEHQDRRREADADRALRDAAPFEIDRKLLKDVVREKMATDVGRIQFLSSGTFHKAYLVTLSDGRELVARVARRFMPRLKTESEVATMAYLREYTNIPVPIIYYYDSNPYNRLGGEYIIMSKAQGIPLSKVYHSMSYRDLVKLLTNLAELVIPLFSHRFSRLGSLYFNPAASLGNSGSLEVSSTPTPTANGSTFPLSPNPTVTGDGVRIVHETPRLSHTKPFLSSVESRFHVGSIISWPFFGSNRGDLAHPGEIDRGPWTSTQAYLDSCAAREIGAVVRENEGRAAPHKLHLDPDAIATSWHHHLKAVPGDESDASDEWDLEESEGEWDGPGDAMYRDYRRMQRSTFLIAHCMKREEMVRREMARWVTLIDRLMEKVGVGTQPEQFGLDTHDLNLENVFVDEHDSSKITCIIDWESTTTRPLWACAHLPAFLQSSPFTSDLFRDVVRKLANGPTATAALAREWLQYESAGMRLRMAHLFVEWDGWEEGLAESILGPEEFDDEWVRDVEVNGATTDGMHSAPPASNTNSNGGGDSPKPLLGPSMMRKATGGRHPFAKEKLKTQMLNTTGDICGGRGGELGRRLEAWLSNGNENGEKGVLPRRWNGDEEEDDS